MAQRNASHPQSFVSSLFWPVMTLIAALTAGGIFAFVFAEIGENGWRQGAGLGLLVFVVAAVLFGRLNSGSLPPPNTVKINVAPAPTVRLSAAAKRRAAAPPPTAEDLSQAARSGVEDVKVAVASAVEKVKYAVDQGAERLTDDGPPETQDGTSEAQEPPTASARVSDAAKKAGEAARAMADAVSGPMPPAEPVKPESLSAAREGGPDDLKKIKGVGPKLEELLHSLGFYHFDQVAAWGPGEVAWVDSNLEGFNGRATRDDWVGQAKILASGGETEFSGRVETGEVNYDD